MRSLLLRGLLAATLLLGAVNALAAIVVQYTDQDPYGVSKTATSTTPYINATGTSTFTSPTLHDPSLPARASARHHPSGEKGNLSPPFPPTNRPRAS